MAGIHGGGPRLRAEGICMTVRREPNDCNVFSGRRQFWTLRNEKYTSNHFVR